MAVSIDWEAATIDVPQSDLTYVPADDVYVLDSDAFRLELKELEADLGEGITWTKTHDHVTEVDLAGTTYARFVIVLPPYSVRFENTGSAYTVRVEGSNNNIIDPSILTPTPLVSYVSTNSAGLIVRVQPVSGLLPDEAADLAAARKWATNRQEIVDISGVTYLDTYDDDGTTLLHRQLMTDADDNPVDLPGANPIKRGPNTL